MDFFFPFSMEPIPIIIYLSIQDLLAVRKIPLKGRSYLGPVGDGGMVVASSPGTSTSNGPTIDPAARELRREMQRIVNKNRDLKEKICSSFNYFSFPKKKKPDFECSPPSPPLLGCKGICLVCSCIL